MRRGRWCQTLTGLGSLGSESGLDPEHHRATEEGTGLFQFVLCG